MRLQTGLEYLLIWIKFNIFARFYYTKMLGDIFLINNEIQI